MTKATLAQMRVLEIARSPAAAYCGRLLADHGADVIKVEPPGGSDDRWLAPFRDDRIGDEDSVCHLFLNANKRSVTLDISTVSGRELLRRLAGSVELIVEDQGPDWLEKAGLVPDDLFESFPSLVITSISPFGRNGPYSEWVATDLIVESMGGWVWGMGEAQREPLRPPGHQSSILGGLWAAISSLGALPVDGRGGGEHIDVSMTEAVTLFLMNPTTTYEYSGSLSPRHGGSSDVNYPQGVFRCKDGLVGILVMYYVEWDRFCEFLGKPEWQEDPRLRTPLDRSKNRHVIAEVLEPWLMEHTAEEIYDMGQQNRLPFAMVNSPLDLMESKQLRFREYWRTYDHPVHGEITVPGPPFKMSGSEWQIRRPAPGPGADTDEVVGDLTDLGQSDRVAYGSLRVLS